MGFDTDNIQVMLDYKVNYTSLRFIKLEGNGNGFLVNTLNFWTVDFIILLLVFLLCRFIFYNTF